MQPSLNDLNLLKKSKIKTKKRFDHHGNYYEILSNHFNFKWLKFFQKCYFLHLKKSEK